MHELRHAEDDSKSSGTLITSPWDGGRRACIDAWHSNLAKKRVTHQIIPSLRYAWTCISACMQRRKHCFCFGGYRCDEANGEEDGHVGSMGTILYREKLASRPESLPHGETDVSRAGRGMQGPQLDYVRSCVVHQV